MTEVPEGATPDPDVTALLVQWSRGDAAALDRLMPLVYEELRQISRRYLASERTDHTLQPTALVHEAYFRIVDQRRVEWRDRWHFFAVAAQLMRRILVDHERGRRAAKRAAGERVALDEAAVVADGRDVNLLALDAALDRLAVIDPDKSRLVEMRFFAGLTIDEIATAQSVSTRTVQRQWRLARLWLYRELRDGDAAPTSDARSRP
jgi:RNA polymerase sigma factor (TIGR02999 family)